MDISFIIVNWNTRHLLLDCLTSIRNTVSGYTYEIIVVDNGSCDGSTEAVREHFGDTIALIENSGNLGFARANNQALRIASGRYAVLLNSDTVLKKDTVSGLIDFFEQTPSAAMAGPCMQSADGTVQNSFDNFPALVTELLNKSILRRLFPDTYAGKAPGKHGAIEVDSLIGACIAVRSAAVAEVGFFDEDYFFFLEETDWCMRIQKAGWKIFHLPHVAVVHLQGQSKKQRPCLAWIEYYRSLYLFFKKNRSVSSYLLLRVFRFVKLIINLLLTLCGVVFTLGGRKRYREKTVIYARLLWWHLCGCPRGVGLAHPLISNMND